MNSGFWMTDCFLGAAMAVPLWTLGLTGFGNASPIDVERAACNPTVGYAPGDLRVDPGTPRSAFSFALYEQPTDILGVIPDVPQGSVRVSDSIASTDPDQRFLGGEWFAAKLHAVFAGTVGEAAISVGGVDISL